MKRIKDKLTIYFRPKKQKSGKSSYLYCRLILNSVQATDFSTFIKVSGNWNQPNQMFIGKDLQTQELNQRLSDIKVEINYSLRDLSKSEVPTVRALRKKYLNYLERVTLVDLSNRHINKIKKRIGQPGYTRGTLKAHQTLHMHILNYLSFKKRLDIAIVDIQADWGRDYVEYLKFHKKYAQNFVVKSLNYVKNLLTEATEEGKISRNPLVSIREEKVEPGEICFLTEKEMHLLKNNPLLKENLERVADAFLFQCHTGLAYADLVRFSAKKHITEIQGRSVIQFSRTKTQTHFTIPVFEYTKHLLDKYENQIPVLSNQKMNQYLKEIAKTVGIEKDLTTHIGRKTAGTYLLNKDVPMIVVSKILGHSSIKTTEKIYAHLFAETILRHTAHLI